MSEILATKKLRTIRPGRGVVTIPEFFERSVREYADQIIFRKRSKNGVDFDTYTYEEAGRIVRRLARVFVETFGLKPGMHAAVVGDNRPEWAFAYFAIHWAGAVVVPVDARLTPTEIRHILDHGEVVLIVAQDRYIGDLLDMKDAIPSLKYIVSMDPYPDEPSVPVLADLVEHAPGEMERVPRELDDLAVILYTSGTTGSSKGVMLTHRNIVSNVDDIYAFMDYGPGDMFFSVLPIHHSFENTAGFLGPIYGGATITFSRSILRPREMRADMLDTRPTFFLAVPLLFEKIVAGIFREVKRAPAPRRAMFQVLWNLSKLTGGKLGATLFKPVRAKLGLDRLKLIVSGGAALPPWVGEALKIMGFPLIQGYGLSETSPVLTVNPPERPKHHSVGLPLPSVELKIFQPDEEGVGEIVARGPNIMKGYFKNEEATREVLDEDGWFYTGDLGYLDPDGYLVITGRKKSVIVTKGGKNIYPEEIENVLSQSPMVEEILALGIRTPEGDEQVHVIIYPNYENVDLYFREKGIQNPTEEDVEAVIRDSLKAYLPQLASYKRPRTFSIRQEEFEKTTTRKIKRFLYTRQPVPIEERRVL